MPYSITTKDGIKINNIPDNIDPNSAQLRERVAQLRSERTQGAEPQTIMGARSQAAGQVFDEPASGSRMTPQMESLPELSDIGVGGLVGGGAKAAALSPVLLSATNPSEIAQIITSSFPEVSVVQNKDARGDVFPILVNNETGAATMINKPGITGMDVLQGLGMAAAFTPAGAASTIPRVAGASAATEALMQGGQAAAGGEFDTKDVVLSGALGGAFKGGEELLSGGLRAAQGSPKSALVSQGEDVGIPVLTSDVMPPQTFASKALRETGEKIPVLGTGEVRAAQQNMRVEAVDRVASKYGEFSYDSIVGSLRSQKDKVKKAAGNVLNKTGEKLDSVADQVPINNTNEAAALAKAELSKPTAITSQAAKEDLEMLMDVLDQPLNFTALKELRTSFREVVKGTDKAERSQLTSRVKGLLQRVEKGMGDDMKAFAKENLDAGELSKWNRANSVYAEEAEKLTKTRLKNVLDKGNATPEVVENMLFSRKPSEVAILNKSLTEEGRKNARSAIVSRIVKDGTRPSSGLTPNSFTTSFERFSPQVKTFFKGEELKQLEGLKEVLQATSRAQQAATTTQTGQALLIPGMAISGAAMPLETLVTAGTISGLTRLYESAPVRNALLRLASAPKRSNAYDIALREAVEAMESSAQSLRSLETESILEE